MANNGVATKRAVISSSTLPSSEPEHPKEWTRKEPRRNLKISFNLPLTPEEAATRIINNYISFGLLYTIFIWVVLFITLIPARKLSLLLMAIMTNVASSYLFLLRALPDSEILHGFVDKWFVLALIAFITAVELILTHAGLHLLFTLIGGIPITLVHAILKVRAHVFVVDDASAVGESVPLVDDNLPKLSDMV